MLRRPAPRKKIVFFRSTLIRWFQKNERTFKWRKEFVPFKILVAEMMLQRTRAEQVEGVYAEFISRFENIESLAHSQIREISEFVNRIGLSRRSKIFIEMARNIMNNHNGVIPSKREDLLDIPGIGDYIADAMIVYAFGGKKIAIDTNVVRLVSRFFGIALKGEGRRDRTLIEFCQLLLRDSDSIDLKKLNWALVDFPALVCKKKPLCYGCQLATKCAYFKKEINTARVLN